MLTPDQALGRIFESLPLFHKEDCALVSAHGRVLRADLHADRDLPPYDRVTMDGYALRSSAAAAGTRRFRVEALQAAGMRPFVLKPEPEACVEVMTGAVLPEGADCVVSYEEASREGPWIQLDDAFKADPHVNVHRRGSDHRSGEAIVRAGTRLTGREIAVAAACGHAAVTVSHSPKIAVISTGDELVDVDALVGPHQVRRSNDYAIRAALIQSGYPRVERFHLRDIRHEIEHMLWHLLAEYDVLLVTGGVSKGKFDLLPEELGRQGVHRIFQGVAQRPGKPFWFGLSRRASPVFALPGNPVSAYTCLHRYVLPALEHASGAARRRPLKVALGGAFTLKPKLACLLPVTLSSGPGATLVATPAPVGTSGDLAGLVGTDGFIELPPTGGTHPRGTEADFWRWA